MVLRLGLVLGVKWVVMGDPQIFLKHVFDAVLAQVALDQVAVAEDGVVAGPERDGKTFFPPAVLGLAGHLAATAVADTNELVGGDGSLLKHDRSFPWIEQGHAPCQGVTPSWERWKLMGGEKQPLAAMIAAFLRIRSVRSRCSGMPGQTRQTGRRTT